MHKNFTVMNQLRFYAVKSGHDYNKNHTDFQLHEIPVVQCTLIAYIYKLVSSGTVTQIVIREKT
jgi:hypothetical protein